MDVEQRRTELKQLIEEVGIHQISRAEMARKYNVTPTQINRDIKEIMNELPQVNWVSIFKEASQDFDRTLVIANKAMDETSDRRLKAKLAAEISEMLLRKMSFLEKMERLLPMSAKPEPVTIIYRCLNPSSTPTSVVPTEQQKIDGEQSND